MSSDRFGDLPKKGDLIEASCGHYKHWFVYVGHGFVVHLTDLVSGGFVSGRSARALVRKDPIPEQEEGYKYRINNKYDKMKEPLCAAKIVLNAELMVGQKILYSLTKFNCEHFMTQMRYGVPMCEQVNESKAESLQEIIQTRLSVKHALPGILLPPMENQLPARTYRFSTQPKPGDLIEIFRGPFEHWAVYVGGGYVVHLTSIDTGVSGINLIGSVSGLSTKAMVKKELLTHVAAGNKYWVNNKLDQKMRPRCAEEIVRLAEAQVGEVMSYNITSSNCEHFVTDLRYGVPICEQVQNNASDLLIMAVSAVNPLTVVDYGREMPSTSGDGFGNQPKKGDLIEASCGLFKHWAVYLEDGYVIHMTKLVSGGFVSDTSSPAVVRKDLLPEQEEGYRYRINNKYDKKMEPLFSEEIVRRAEEMVGKEILYSLTNYNYEHFVTELRYGVPMCDQYSSSPQPIPGDLIEIFRGPFEHWAVCVGDDYVVHLTNIDTGVSGINLIGSASGLSTTAMVKKELLTQVAAGNKYRVNNKHDQKMRPRCAEEIVRLAEAQVGEVMPYHLTSSNCEHFVTALRYGVPVCEQVQKKASDLLTMAVSAVHAVNPLTYGRQMLSASE